MVQFTDAHYYSSLGAASPNIGGQATLTLNGNGTIAVELVSYYGQIVGFGLNSENHFLSNAPSGFVDTSWYTAFGHFESGISSGFQGSGSSLSWSIGSFGQFSSLSQLFSGPNSFDVFLHTDQGQWAANVAAVPEPSTWAMVLLGFAGMGFLVYRNSRSNEDAAVAKNCTTSALAR